MSDDSLSYKCPACGAGISFNTGAQRFLCEYCGSSFSDVSQLDPPLSGGEAVQAPTDDFTENNRLYLCPSCGAAVITDCELSASAECYYCHSPVVLSGRLSGEYRPDSIIPFKKTREQAIAGFREWTKKKKSFLAKGFGSEESLSKMQAIYIPFWLADCTVDAYMKADCYKLLGTKRKGNYLYFTEEKRSSVRAGTVTYSAVPADGSRWADDALMDSIEPFDTSGLRPFDMSYLSGHSAVRYDVGKELVLSRIQTRVLEDGESYFKSQFSGYHHINIVSKDVKITDMKWENVMLPIWFMTFAYKGKMYYYAMNGQTGKLGGTLPINKLKILLFSLIPIAIGLFLSFAVSFLESLV